MSRPARVEADDVYELPDPDWFFDNVLFFDKPGGGRGPLLPAAAWQQWWRTRSIDGAVGRVAVTQGFVLGTPQLTGLGVGRPAARYAVRRGRWVGPARGVIAPLSVEDAGADRFLIARRRHTLSATAAVLGRADLAISARSASILHGLPVDEIPVRPEITVRDGSRSGNRVTRHLYAASLPDSDIQEWFGANVTGVARTVVDLARHNRRDGLMAADAALREQLVTRSAIDSQLAAAAGWPGVQQARDTLELASPLAESALESLVRLALHDAGLPMPALQVRIGRFRADMCWEQRRLVLEVDGLAKYDAAEWRREKRREQELRALGYRIERTTWDDLRYRWPETVARLRVLLGL